MLALHDSESFPGTQECAGQVGVHNGFPLLVHDIFKKDRWSENPGIVKQDVYPPAKGFCCP
jgi:hypothetical protein